VIRFLAKLSSCGVCSRTPHLAIFYFLFHHSGTEYYTISHTIPTRSNRQAFTPSRQTIQHHSSPSPRTNQPQTFRFNSYLRIPFIRHPHHPAPSNYNPFLKVVPVRVPCRSATFRSSDFKVSGSGIVVAMVQEGQTLPYMFYCICLPHIIFHRSNSTAPTPHCTSQQLNHLHSTDHATHSTSHSSPPPATTGNSFVPTALTPHPAKTALSSRLRSCESQYICRRISLL